MRTFTDSTYSITLNRILASKQMRRLKGKKQVFSLLVAQTDSKADYIHERMLHTLEVCSVAKEVMKKICKGPYTFTMSNWAEIEEDIKYSEDLLEAIAFAHDFGHTPFGHIGEQALTHYMKGENQCLRTFEPSGTSKGGNLAFKHNYYSAALLSRNFSVCSPDIIDGVLKHTKINKFDGEVYDSKRIGAFGAHSYLPESLRKEGYLANNACYTLEGQVVAMADEIAQMLSDLEDSNLVIEDIFTDDDLTKVLLKSGKQTMKEYLLDQRERMIKSLILQTRQNISEYLSKSSNRFDNKVIHFKEQVVCFDKEMKEFFENLEKLRSAKLHSDDMVKKQNCLSYMMIYKIFDYYLTNPKVFFGKDHKSFEYVINNFLQIREDSKHKKGEKHKTKHLDYVDKIKEYDANLYLLIEGLKFRRYNEKKDEYRKKYLEKVALICEKLGKYYFNDLEYNCVMDSLAKSLMREISFSIGKMTDNFAVSTFIESFDKDHRDSEIDRYIEKCCASHANAGLYTLDEKYLDFFKKRVHILKTCLTTMGDYNKV